MASKKLKRAIIAGVGAGILSKMGQASEMKEYLASEGGSKSKISAITKKANPNTFMGKVKKAVNVYKTKGLNTGRGPNIKPSDSLADKVLSGNVMGLTDMGGAKAGKMIKAKGGKEIVGKKTKLY